MKTTYKKILTLLEKHESELVFDVNYMKRQAENHLFGLELKEMYGLNIDPKKVNSTTWHKLNDYCSIGFFGEKHNRTISWPDVKGQPKNELLLYFSFSTGAYMFGEDYPTGLFNDFWNELKSYKPKYSDTINHNLYFDLPNAKDVFNNFDVILRKYIDLNKEDYKLREISKLKEDLAKLESE